MSRLNNFNIDPITCWDGSVIPEIARLSDVGFGDGRGYGNENSKNMFYCITGHAYTINSLDRETAHLCPYMHQEYELYAGEDDEGFDGSTFEDPDYPFDD